MLLVCVCTLLHSIAGDLKHELHASTCMQASTPQKKIYIADFQLCCFAYGCGEGVKKQKLCARRGEQCEMCVLSAGVLATPVCSSQGDLWPTLLKLKVHPQFRGRFTQRSTGYSATRALSLFLPPSLPPSPALFSIFSGCKQSGNTNYLMY